MSKITTIGISGTFNIRFAEQLNYVMSVQHLQLGDFLDDDLQCLNLISNHDTNLRPNVVHISRTDYPEVNNDFAHITATFSLNHLSVDDQINLINAFAKNYMHLTGGQDVMPIGYWYREMENDYNLIIPNLEIDSYEQTDRTIELDYYSIK